MQRWLAVSVAALGMFLVPQSRAADEIGIFEMVFESAAPFAETSAALETAIAGSSLTLHGMHDLRLPDATHHAKIFVVTSPEYVEAAADESPRTISAQVLRIAVYTLGAEKKTYVNMANPVAHAMVFYAESPNRDALVAAAERAAGQIRELVSALPGTAVSRQLEPARSARHYAKFKGDGPARMMAKFRTWRKSQLQITSDSIEDFDAVVDSVTTSLAGGSVSGADEATGWDTVAVIPLRDDAVYIGLTNPFIEDKMVRINSRFRGDNKSDEAPYPGVDHAAALPTDVLVVKEGERTLVLHYGQMWRMQLYFWDSGYRAFTANVGVPSQIAKSIRDAVTLAP